MDISGKAVLITGANRGIGRALLEEALKRGASRAYAATRQPFLDLLINNAGISMLEQHLAVNLFGPYGMTQAFLPLLTRSTGAILNNLSMLALAPLPVTPAYAL